MIGHGYISTSVFNVEEMEFINNHAANVNGADFTKEYLLNAITFNGLLTSEQDVKEFCSNLHLNVSSLTTEEFSFMQSQIPFPVLYSDYDVAPENV